MGARGPGSPGTSGGAPEGPRGVREGSERRPGGIRKSVQEGFIFGLTICAKLIQNIDGKISVESEMGEGSTFIISLPMKLEE